MINLSKIHNENAFGRLLRLPLKLIPKNMQLRILQGKLRGKKWIVGSGVHGYWLGSYEYESQVLFTRIVEPGSVVYDIGAHAGFYTLLASVLTGEKGKVFAFEPFPENIQYLKKHLELNKCNNVTVIEKAVTEDTGSVFFEKGQDNTMGRVSAAGALKVETITLDEFVFEKGVQKPDYIKIDVEGSEMSVLSGAKSVIAKYKPVIFLSVHSDALRQQCCSFLKDAGYNLYPVNKKKSVEESSELLASGKYNLAVVHSHPIQYYAPFYRKLNLDPQIDLTVYYYKRSGSEKYRDPELGMEIKWDTQLLEGYRYKFLKNYSPLGSSFNFLSFFNPGIFKELSKNRYDAVIIHGYGFLMDWLAYAAAGIANTPVIFRGEAVLHPDKRGFLDFVRNVLLKSIFPNLAAFLTIGTKNREFLRHYGVPERKLFFAPYSVDNEYFISQSNLCKSKIRELRNSLNVPGNIPVILYVGKLIEKKRPMDLLVAFSKLPKDSAFLIFAGEGSLRASLERYVKANGTKNVLFAGFVNQGQLPAYYAISDVFVLPSSWEPWGLVVNEAMCAGLPVIVSDMVTCGVDLVKSGENGFVYPVGDTQKLCGHISYLVNNPDLRKKIGRRSLEIISGWNYDGCVEGIKKSLSFTAVETGLHEN